MDTTTKTGIDATKTASKRVVEKTTEATGELIGYKIADKITSLGKTNSKEKEDERLGIYIPPEKRQQNIDDLIIPYNKNQYQNTNTKKYNTKKSQTYQVQRPMRYLDLLLKNGQKFMISQVMLKIDINPANK